MAGKFKIKSIQYLLDSNVRQTALPNQSKIQLKMMLPYLKTMWSTHFTRRLLVHPLIKKENNAKVDVYIVIFNNNTIVISWFWWDDEMPGHFKG